MAQDAGKVATHGADGTATVAGGGAGVYAPSLTDTNNQVVGTGAAVDFPVVAGRQYIVSATTEQTFADGGVPTATTGMILHAASMIGPFAAKTNMFRIIATTTAGRASVSQVFPA